jgi:hypothetical protein
MMREVGPFIYEIENALSADFCQQAIDRFESDDRKAPGVTWTGKIDPKKKCTDLRISDHKEWADIDKTIFESTGQALQHMHHKSPIFMESVSDTGYQMQKYKSDDYYAPHIDGSIYGGLDRILALIWYLNDVEKGGETDFPELGVRVKAQTGKLLMFAPYWTHVHQGLPPISNSKYIITTFILTKPRSER